MKKTICAAMLALAAGLMASVPVSALVTLKAVTQVREGDHHSCALTRAGGVKCWGDNTSGQLGDGTTTQRFTAVNVVGLTSGVVAIAAGGSQTCALTSAGGVKCWGANSSGQLGDGTRIARHTPVDVSGLASGVSAITAGYSHVCALTGSGGLKCWGQNFSGQLGDGTTLDRLTAVDVLGLTVGAVEVSAGQLHTCARTTAGGAKCWGSNYYGQLGDGTIRTTALTALDVSGLATGVASISAGWSHTCAVTTAGAAQCWGDNAEGELGTGSGVRSLTPIVVAGLATGVASIWSARTYTCAVTTVGGAKCWGSNFYGQLGDGSRESRLTPVDVSGLTSGIASISAGSYHTCAVATRGSVRCWGHSFYGQVGNNVLGQRLTPVVALIPNASARAVTAGYAHTCVLNTAGGVKCWGANRSGQLGDGTTTTRFTAGDVPGLGSGVSAISAGANHTCALMLDGTVKCWGANYFGQIGDGTNATRPTPTLVWDHTAALAGITAISAGYGHTCALNALGGVKCWGDDSRGQIGIGRPGFPVYFPMDVTGLTSGIAAVSASSGLSHTCAVTTEGAAKCWGDNTYGQLGDGTMVMRTTAVDVVGLTAGVTGIFAGASHTCALTTGDVKCWGNNSEGELGDGTNTAHIIASGVPGLTGASAFSAGYWHNCALAASGGAVCWANNFFGQLGDGTTTQRLAPVPVSGLGSSVVSIAAGRDHSCAVTASGAVACWGSNLEGELGDGTGGIQLLPTSVFVLDPLDLNMDGTSDLVWEHTDGRAAVWLMRGASALEAAPIVPAGTGWGVSAIADFNGDGMADLLWTHADGRVGLWLMNAATASSAAVLLPAATGWRVGGTGDFNGDGKSDLVWQHGDGSVAMWLMNGTSAIGGATLLTARTGWIVASVADLDGDGRSDLVWRHLDGRVAIWLMNGTAISSAATVLGPGTGWRVVHASDLNGDGKSDLVWTHTGGSTAVWLMNGLASLGAGTVLGPGTGWSVVASGDFNGDGNGDLYWQHTDGRAAIWLMNGLTALLGADILPAASGWSMRRTGDFNADGKTDIIWRHVDGRVAIWLMDATAVTGSAVLVGPATGWTVSSASP